MIKAGDTRIAALIADDGPHAPYGRSREFLIQIDPGTADATVILDGPREVKLRDLSPEHRTIG